MNFKLERISATNLAGLAADDFCPRCFWLKSRLGFKLPFAMFPKVFQELDKYQKTFTESYWRSNGVLPPWLKKYEVEEIIQVPEYGKFCAQHECGVMVSGITDHMFRLVSQKNVVFDYKTSHPFGDKMQGIYKTQLSTYAWISPRFGFGEVEKVALVYYEPQTAITEWGKMSYPMGYPTVEGLCINFRPLVIEMEIIDINPLILKAQQLAEGAMPMASQYCKECDRILDWVETVSHTSRVQD